MFHDVLLVVGLFAWLDKPIDGIFLAAVMTIVGLSVNDTVVVFDRIRERWWGSRPDEDFNAVANRAAVETIPRTVNTGLGSMFILAALAILGGDSLQDFAIALLRRPDRRYLLLGLHRHADADLLPGEVADGSGQEGEGRARGRGLRRRRLRFVLADPAYAGHMLWILLFVVIAVVAYKYRVKILAKVLGQPESRIERQIERRKR